MYVPKSLIILCIYVHYRPLPRILCMHECAQRIAMKFMACFHYNNVSVIRYTRVFRNVCVEPVVKECILPLRVH